MTDLVKRYTHMETDKGKVLCNPKIHAVTTKGWADVNCPKCWGKGLDTGAAIKAMGKGRPK